MAGHGLVVELRKEMICFLVCRGYEFTVSPLQRDQNAPEIKVISYSKALHASVLPKATYIFVDIDRLSNPELVSAGRLFRRLAAAGCRVLNDPGRVRTRFPLLRSLYRQGLNGFNVFSLDEVSKPKRFPVFIRVSDDHAGPLTDLIGDQQTLQRAIEALTGIGYPRSTLIIVEYAAKPIRPGIFRKLSVFRVADRYLPHVCVHDSNWVIKAGRSGGAPSELYDEELDILRTNPFAERMKPVFETGEIDFGRVDFSFVDDQLCIYEINTNPTLARPAQHAFPQRMESMKLWWQALLLALHAIDDPAKEGSNVDVSVDDASTLRHALDIYPFVKDGFLRACEAHSRRGESEAAIRYAECALAQAPDDARVMLRVSKLLADNNLLKEAIDIVSRNNEGHQQDFDLLVHKARLLARAKRGTDAVEAVSRAIRLRPKDVRSYRALSEVRWTLGDSKAALMATKEAIKLLGSKNDPGTAKQLAELQAQQRTLQNEVVRQRFSRIRGPFWRQKG